MVTAVSVRKEIWIRSITQWLLGYCPVCHKWHWTAIYCGYVGAKHLIYWLLASTEWSRRSIWNTNDSTRNLIPGLRRSRDSTTLWLSSVTRIVVEWRNFKRSWKLQTVKRERSFWERAFNFHRWVQRFSSVTNSNRVVLAKRKMGNHSPASPWKRGWGHSTVVNTTILKEHQVNKDDLFRTSALESPLFSYGLRWSLLA